jgi:hypothetical protein
MAEAPGVPLASAGVGDESEIGTADGVGHQFEDMVGEDRPVQLGLLGRGNRIPYSQGHGDGANAQERSGTVGEGESTDFRQVDCKGIEASKKSGAGLFFRIRPAGVVDIVKNSDLNPR